MFKFVACFLVALIVAAALGGYLFVANYGQAGSGISKTESRDLESFERIELSEFGTLNVTIGETPRVTVTTDDNLVQLVETVVENGCLRIKPVTAINPQVDLVIDVTLPKLTSVEVAGAASLNLKDIQAESLDIELSGACHVQGSGSVTDLSLEMSGACRAKLRSLKTENTVVEISGTGSATVFASVSLQAEASGLAKIACYGNPTQVQREAHGISKVTLVKQ